MPETQDTEQGEGNSGANTPKDNGEENSGGDSKGAASVTATLTGVAMLVAPLVTAIGALALTGTIGRVQRNEPALISIALGFVLAAGTTWVIAEQLEKVAKKALRITAAGIALGGFAIGLYAAVATANDEPRPQIKAKLSKQATKLTAKINASNMETEDRLAIWVDVLARDRDEPDDFSSAKPVVRAYEGPDGDGNVNIKVSTFCRRAITPTLA